MKREWLDKMDWPAMHAEAERGRAMMLGHMSHIKMQMREGEAYRATLDPDSHEYGLMTRMLAIDARALADYESCMTPPETVDEMRTRVTALMTAAT